MLHTLVLDGQRYEKSDYLHQVIVRAAKELGEDCGCWNTSLFEFSVSLDQDDLKFKIKCSDRLETCKKAFLQTEKRIENIFKNVYKNV